MKDRLSKEEVLKLADLAKLELSEEEILKYQIELKEILDDIEKIKDLDCDSDEILIAPFCEEARLFDDIKEDHLELEDLLANAPKKSANMLEVPVMLND